MNIQLKQKIIGIAVVAIFLAIAVPFLLSGSKNKQNNTANTAANLATNTGALNLPPNQDPADNKISSNDQQPPAAQPTPAPQPAPEPIASITPAQQNVASLPQPMAANVNATSTSLNKSTAAIPDKTIASPQQNINAPINNTHPTPPISANQPKIINQPTAITTQPGASNTVSNQNPALQASLAQKENDIVSNTSHKKIKNHKIKTVKIKHKNAIKNADGKKATNTLSKKQIKKKPLPSSQLSQTPQHWTVRISGYQDKQTAENLVKKLAKDNYQATIQTIKIKKKTLHYVVLSSSSKERAENLAKKIEKNFGVKTKLISY